MKTQTFTSNPIAQAVLSESGTHESLAILTADLSLSEDGWCQLLPAGKFKAPDGRPAEPEDGYWYLDTESAHAFIAATKATRHKVLVDYDHQTLYTEQTGKKAPASGWLTSATDIEWREGQGLYVRPDWTDKAKGHIDAKEYAYLSAVFPYDKKTGRPLYLRMAAITNDPGIPNMESVAALAADFNVRLSKQGVDVNLYGETQEAFVNEALKQLLAKLGITVEGELTDELATAALTALDALTAQAQKAGDLETQVVALKASGGSHAALQKAYEGVVTELATLKAGSDEASLTALLDGAKQEGKIVEAEVDYLTEHAKNHGVAALKSLLEARPAIAALTSTQTKDKQPPKDKQENTPLSDAELAVLKATGLTQKQFLAAKEEDDS
ncbi:phage protease [Vibrio nigripulchritudo]|uniref:phage protease n=1 Tax=Vibrio nigripulchritudo TaxID=28173 RepID=UPI0007E52029|nr:phage protease [Vibrio nigripulchritudo]